jgi:hypothetical protein
MARPRGYKRLTRKARHVIRHLRRTKHASVQDQMVHELRHEVSRTHGFSGPKKAPDRSGAGMWRPLTRKAKKILSRLRRAKVWSVQKQLVNELAREIEHGRRLAERARERARRAAARVRAARRRTARAGRATARGARAVGRGARKAGRGARKAGQVARPHVTRAGRAVRSGVRKAHEPHLRRAEARADRRAQERRTRGPQSPPPRGRLAPGGPRTPRPVRTRSPRVPRRPRIRRPARAR